MSQLTFFGDAYLDQSVPAHLPWVGEYVLNLEAPITHSNRPQWGKINLKAEGVFFAETFSRNPVAVNLANNHIMDYGVEGFLDTLASLQAQGIRYFGAGSLDDNCHNPLLLDASGQRIALLGYVCPSTQPLLVSRQTPGAAPLELERIAADIGRSKENAVVIVQLHWGEEDVGLPRPEDVETARRIVALGADLVIGHHAHCIQPFEVYRGKHIFYGLGNTVFPVGPLVSYTEEGRPQGNRSMGWRAWNRKSLAVQYDAASRRVSVRLLRFAAVLEEVPHAAAERKFSFHPRLGARYRWRYAAVKYGSVLRRLLASFIARPRLPKRANWRWLFRLFRQGGRS